MPIGDGLWFFGLPYCNFCHDLLLSCDKANWVWVKDIQSLGTGEPLWTFMLIFFGRSFWVVLAWAPLNQIDCMTATRPSINREKKGWHFLSFEASCQHSHWFTFHPFRFGHSTIKPGIWHHIKHKHFRVFWTHVWFNIRGAILVTVSVTTAKVQGFVSTRCPIVWKAKDPMFSFLKYQEK